MTGKKKTPPQKKEIKKRRIAPGGIEPGAVGVKGPHATTAPRHHIHITELQLSI